MSKKNKAVEEEVAETVVEEAAEAAEETVAEAAEEVVAEAADEAERQKKLLQSPQILPRLQKHLMSRQLKRHLLMTLKI